MTAFGQIQQKTTGSFSSKTKAFFRSVRAFIARRKPAQTLGALGVAAMTATATFAPASADDDVTYRFVRITQNNTGNLISNFVTGGRVQSDGTGPEQLYCSYGPDGTLLAASLQRQRVDRRGNSDVVSLGFAALRVIAAKETPIEERFATNVVIDSWNRTALVRSINDGTIKMASYLEPACEKLSAGSLDEIVEVTLPLSVAASFNPHP